MRIKEELKISGLFWRPSEPDRKLPGTLSISDGGHIELGVFGQFGGRIEISPNVDLNPIERIVGYIKHTGEDKYVTLDDCRYTLPLDPIMGGISKSLIHVGKVFIGVGYDECERPVFNALTFSVEGIDEWVGISGLSAERHFEESAATISYQRPEDISINLDNGMRLSIIFGWTPPGAPLIKEAKIIQKTYFKLELEKGERELKEFTSVANKITTFLCFAIDKTVSLDCMKATADNLRRDRGGGQTEPIPIIIYYSSRPYSKDEPKSHWNDMLFGFGKIQSDFQEKIKNWIGAYEKTYPAFNLYFSAKREEQRYLDEKFLTLTRGLDTYYIRIFGDCRSVPLGQRIKCIIEPFKEIIGNEDNRRNLICKIKCTRNDLTHCNRLFIDVNSQAAEARRLWRLYLKTELLFQLLFLWSIGFSLEDINSIVANYPQIQCKINLQL